MFHRMTISVTVDLKRRMEMRGDINWSAVARDAFEAVLASSPDVALEAAVQNLTEGLQLVDVQSRDAAFLALKRQYEAVNGYAQRGGDRTIHAKVQPPRFSVWLSAKTGMNERTIEKAVKRALAREGIGRAIGGRYEDEDAGPDRA